MPNRDFFSFCTSLKPLELKALGALSHVRHLGAGKIVYQAGETADRLYIINRGVVEILGDDSAPAMVGRIFLARGDIFGDAEVLTARPRRNSIQTLEAVSLQCFQQEDLAELVQRVPSFFLYLSEQLAGRLLQARETAATPQMQSLELSGSLANFDLVTIYQTIVNSSQTGELAIRDDNGEPLGAFDFEAGRIRGAQFQHLTGEEAFSQLFLGADQGGSFAFSTGPSRNDRALASDIFKREPCEILINAIRERDELEALRKEMPDSSSRLLRQKLEVELSGLRPDLIPIVEKVWSLASGGRLCLGEIYGKLEVCELKIYEAVHQLIKTEQLLLSVETPAARKVT